MDKRRFDDSDFIHGSEHSGREELRISKKFKNSLDSDEDDDECEAEKYNVLEPDEFEGEEESTVDRDGEIEITPFNMRDELEEGHFDKDGTFIFKKNRDDIRDNWLDDIDWTKVKPSKGLDKESTYNSDSEETPELDVASHYKKMLELMEPNETVQSAICRLGKTGNSRNRQTSQKENENTREEQVKKLQLLTSLASDIISNGDMDIYQKTYEKLSYFVNASVNLKSSGNSDGDATSDMFSDTFHENCLKEPELCEDLGEKQYETGESESSVMWEFKWELKEDSPIYGPFSTNEMLRWVQEGYFGSGVFVRKSGATDRQFYNSKRIDFELYL